MKRNIYKNISLAVLTLLAAACQNNDDFGSTYDNDPNAVVVNASIGARTQTRVSTESDAVDKWDDGDIFCVTGGANSNMAIYTYNGTAWAVGNDYLTWNTTGTNDFTAWYPMSATYAAFTLPKNQSVGISKADWMTASATGVSKPENKQLNLEFQHKLSKVIVNVTSYGDEYKQAPSIYDVKFYIAGTPSVTGATVESSQTFVSSLAGTQADGKPCYTAIVLPGTYSSGANFIEMTVQPSGESPQTLTVDVPAALTTAGLTAGKAYTYNLKVGKGGISIASVSVTEWGSTSNMGSGTATEGPAGPAVGDFYYKDGTHSADYKGTVNNPCIGIVIDVDKGLIVSDILSIGKTSWATSAGQTVKTETTNADGREDVKLLKAISSDLSQYPAAKACDTYDAGGTGWYLPSETDVTPLMGNTESAAKWSSIFTTALFTGTGTARSTDGFWTTTESDGQICLMNWISWDFELRYDSDSQYWKSVRCVKRVTL